MDGEALEQTKLKNDSKLQVLQRQEGGAENICNIGEQIQCRTGYHGAKAQGCQRHCLNMSHVEQHCEDTVGLNRQVTHPNK